MEVNQNLVTVVVVDVEKKFYKFRLLYVGSSVKGLKVKSFNPATITVMESDLHRQPPFEVCSPSRLHSLQEKLAIFGND